MEIEDKRENAWKKGDRGDRRRDEGQEASEKGSEEIRGKAGISPRGGK